MPAESKQLGLIKQPDASVTITQLLDGSHMGEVQFWKEEGGTMIIADISGMSVGEHGFHIHNVGDCSAQDGSSAGGHYNPLGVEHGSADDDIRHVGDLGNIESDTYKEAYYERFDSHIRLEGEHSIIGRSVIIHMGRDDLKSQPSGNAGARLGCGVIEVEEEY